MCDVYSSCKCVSEDDVEVHFGAIYNGAPAPLTLNLPNPAAFVTIFARLVVLLDPSRPRDLTHDSGQRPSPRKRAHFATELHNLLRANLALRGYGRGAHKVLEQLAAGLLLHQQCELHRAVEEARDGTQVVLSHVT